jgi:hypothetical protein
MTKVYSNLETGIDRGVIINQDKQFEMYTIKKPNNLFSKYRGFGPFWPLVTSNTIKLINEDKINIFRDFL